MTAGYGGFRVDQANGSVELGAVKRGGRRVGWVVRQASNANPPREGTAGYGGYGGFFASQPDQVSAGPYAREAVYKPAVPAVQSKGLRR